MVRGEVEHQPHWNPVIGKVSNQNPKTIYICYIIIMKLIESATMWSSVNILMLAIII